MFFIGHFWFILRFGGTMYKMQIFYFVRSFSRKWYFSFRLYLVFQNFVQPVISIYAIIPNVRFSGNAGHRLFRVFLYFHFISWTLFPISCSFFVLRDMYKVGILYLFVSFLLKFDNFYFSVFKIMSDRTSSLALL